MTSGLHRFILLVLLCVIGVVCYGEAAPDIENAPTPLTLAELLPEGGIDAVDIDFWVRSETTIDGEHQDTRFMHWSIRGVKGNLVVTYDNGTKGDTKEHRRAQTTYDKTGSIADYLQVTHRHGKKYSETKGKVVGEELVLSTRQFDADTGKAGQVSTRRFPLSALSKSVPSGWFPLVVAYHARNGSLGYRFARTDLHYNFQHAETKVQDVGTEQIEHEGRPVQARLLLCERTFGNRPRDEPHMRIQYLVLPNGEIMYMRTQYYSYQFLGKRTTREAIAKEYWLPPS